MPFVPGFLPSTNAPLFRNDGISPITQQLEPWPPGTVLTVSIPGLPTISLDATTFGLCGGMAFLTRDIFQAGTPQLRNTICTKIPVALANLLVNRLVQSFNGIGVVSNWLLLDALPDHDENFLGIDIQGVFHRTVNECVKTGPGSIRGDVDAGVLSPIGLILTGPTYWPGDVFNNHVVLVWGYELDATGTKLTLHTYDCNYPGDDGITISLDISSTTPAKVISTNGTDMRPEKPNQIRGFWRLPYTFASPAAAYIDDATVWSLYWKDMTPGEKDTAAVVAVNTGSTSWTPQAFIRLGSQSPPNNTIWGIQRVDLPIGQVDPQQEVRFSIPIIAPTAEGQFPFSWQMVRDPNSFFGTPNDAELITVAPAGTPIVPDVTGETVDFAEQILGDAGFKVRATRTGEVDSGTVVRQKPAGGSISTAGATVEIFYATVNR